MRRGLLGVMFVFAVVVPPAAAQVPAGYAVGTLELVRYEVRDAPGVASACPDDPSKPPPTESWLGYARTCRVAPAPGVAAGCTTIRRHNWADKDHSDTCEVVAGDAHVVCADRGRDADSFGTDYSTGCSARVAGTAIDATCIYGDWSDVHGLPGPNGSGVRCASGPVSVSEVGQTLTVRAGDVAYVCRNTNYDDGGVVWELFFSSGSMYHWWNECAVETGPAG
jgi:hypothetical protein